jgi:hypothetical protein
MTTQTSVKKVKLLETELLSKDSFPSVAEFVEYLLSVATIKISHDTLRGRLRRGYTPFRAITETVSNKPRKTNKWSQFKLPGSPLP